MYTMAYAVSRAGVEHLRPALILVLILRAIFIIGVKVEVSAPGYP